VGVQLKLKKAFAILKILHGKHSVWRAGQEALLTAFFQGKDAVGILPTAGGKGDVFLIAILVILNDVRAKRTRLGHSKTQPPLCATVMLPTTALIEDMYERFRKVSTSLKFTCCFLGSTQMDLQVNQQAARGDYDIILGTAEKFSTFIPSATTGPMPGFHVACEFYDEVHTLLDADAYFRPLMLDITSRSMERIPGGPRVVRGAFTATVEDANVPIILGLLPLKDPVTVRVNPKRENIALACREKSIGKNGVHKDCALMYERIIAASGQCVVYTETKKETKIIRDSLNQCHGKALATIYHGDLAPEEKKAAKLLWDMETVQVL
jgi:ATP-dependent DNA helicase RecQ